MFLQLQELQASALRKSIDKEPTPSPEPQALQLTPTTNGELNAKAHSLLCLVHQIVAPSTQAAHAESAAGVTHVPWPKKPLSTHMCTDMYINPSCSFIYGLKAELVLLPQVMVSPVTQLLLRTWQAWIKMRSFSSSNRWVSLCVDHTKSFGQV